MPREVSVEIKVNHAQALKNIQAVEKAASEMKKNLGRSVAIAQESRASEQALARLGSAIGKVNTSQLANLNTMRRWISAQDGMNGGIVRAVGATTNAAGTFQKYKVAVDAGGNSTRNFTVSVNTATGEVYQLDAGIRSMSNSFDTLTKKAYGFISQTVGFTGVAHSMRMAFNEMKKMSDELVTYQKVTGASGAQLSQVRAASFKSAKAYGQTPSDYLTSVSEFARAGYKEQSSAMADLATKTQLVGDITAEAASSFLLATDAGYKFQGNVKQLSSVLDAANTIDNKYATSIAKIAEGMTLTASLANQMNVPIEELMAGIGTMTAVTQRSGSEMGRALRSVMLTIMKDTTSEVEEGVTVTQEQIDSLDAALNKYAKDAVNAANATGKLLNPMEALGSLAQAYKDGLLNDQSLTGILSGIGGQRYSNALIALVQNWDDVYTKMLTDIATAAGSADAEVSAMTNSWTAKLNRFKTVWTETVNNTISEEFIKGFIDAGIGVLEFTGNLENLAITVGGLTLAYKGLSKVIKEVQLSGSLTGVSKGTWGKSIAGLSIVAIGAIKSAYDKYYTDLQASAEAAAASAVEAADSVTNSTHSAIAALKELRSLDRDGNGFTDNDKLEEAKALQEQIVELIGDQADAYDVVSGKLSEITRKIIEQTIAQNNARLNEIVVDEATAANNFAKQGLNNRLFYENGTMWWHPGITLSDKRDAAFIQDFAGYSGSQKYFDITQNKGTTGNTTQFLITFDKPEEVEDMLAMLQEIKELRLWMVNNEYSGEYSALYEQMNDLIAEYEKQLAPVVSARDAKNSVLASNLLFSNMGAETTFSTQAGYEKYIEHLISINHLQGDLAQAVRDTADAYAYLYVKEQQASENEEAANGYDNLTSSIEKATNAKKAFDEAMSTTMADGLNGYREAFETLQKEIDEGRVNSTAAHAAYRMLLGEETYAAAGGNAHTLQGMYESASAAYKTLFGTYTNEHGDVVQGGGLLKLAEQAGLNVRDDGGNYAYTFSDKDIQQIASYSKLSKDIIVSALSALDQYDQLGYNKELLPQGAEAPELTATKDNTTATTDNTTAVEALTQKIGDAFSPVKEIGQGGAAGGNVSSGFRRISDELSLKRFYNNLYKDVDPVVLKAEMDMSDAERELRYFTGKRFTVYGSAKITGYQQDTTPVGGTLKETQYHYAYANGTDTHPGGVALVNDGVGSNAGGELIVENGRAYIANGGRPTLVNLERGARVFNAKDTRSILGKGVPAYAAGNGFLLSGKKPGINEAQTSFDTLTEAKEDSKNSNTPKKTYKTFKELADLMDYVLSRLNTALGEHVEAIDKQIQALQEARNAADSQKELEERQEAVAEAQKDLQDAMNERTVRVLNDDGTWSWQADARKVQQAQEDLKDAEEALKKHQDDLAFEAQVNALENEKERLQQEYETITDRWNEIKNGVNTPTGNIDSVIASILKGGSAADKTGAKAVRDLLIGTLLTGGSFSGNYSEALNAMESAADGSPVMPTAGGLNLAALIAGSETGATDDLVASALSMNSGVLGAYGSGNTYTVTKTGNNYYFNGVQIGNDMLSQPLSETIRRLTVYTNA